MEKLRKLASIQKIIDVRPIADADMIEVVQVNNWNIVSKKGEFKIGDLCVYCEIDSFLPIREEFEFLRKSSYKKMADGTEGFRLKTIRLRGQISQGLVLPLSSLEGMDEMKLGISQQPTGDRLQIGPYDDALVIKEGVDVTEYLNIIKYDPPLPAELAGLVKGNFPSFIPKTDEERIQNLTMYYDAAKGKKFYTTEKLDGTSSTYFLYNNEFGVCSRNLELLETEGNSFWKIARELEIEETLRSIGHNIAIQGELIGEGIQKNPYKLKGQHLRVFNIYMIDEGIHLEIDRFLVMVAALGLKPVPIIEYDFVLPDTIDELILLADAKSKLCDTTDREGLVIRSHDRKISFKVISNKYLLKNGE